MTIVRSVTMLSLARDALERSANDADAAQAYLSERLLNDGYGGNAVLSGPFSTSIVALVADADRNLPPDGRCAAKPHWRRW
jgi:hypothetical protein